MLLKSHQAQAIGMFILFYTFILCLIIFVFTFFFWTTHVPMVAEANFLLCCAENFFIEAHHLSHVALTSFASIGNESAKVVWLASRVLHKTLAAHNHCFPPSDLGFCLELIYSKVYRISPSIPTTNSLRCSWDSIKYVLSF